MPINDEASKSLKDDPTSGAPVSEIEKKLMSAAEELGTWLGTAERKTIELMAQQPKIANELTRIRDIASRLLAELEKGREIGQKK